MYGQAFGKCYRIVEKYEFKRDFIFFKYLILFHYFSND